MNEKGALRPRYTIVYCYCERVNSNGVFGAKRTFIYGDVSSTVIEFFLI